MRGLQVLRFRSFPSTNPAKLRLDPRFIPSDISQLNLTNPTRLTIHIHHHMMCDLYLFLSRSLVYISVYYVVSLQRWGGWVTYVFLRTEWHSIIANNGMYAIIWQIRSDWPVNSRRKQAKLVSCSYTVGGQNIAHLRSYMYDFWMDASCASWTKIHRDPGQGSIRAYSYISSTPDIETRLDLRSNRYCFIGCVSKKNLYYPTNITTAEFESRRQKHTPLSQQVSTVGVADCEISVGMWFLISLSVWCYLFYCWHRTLPLIIIIHSSNPLSLGCMIYLLSSEPQGFKVSFGLDIRGDSWLSKV
jgi:hypothetical protein